MTGKGEKGGDAGTGSGEHSLDSAEKTGSGGRKGCQELLSEGEQSSGEKAQEVSSEHSESGQDLPGRDTGVRKADVIIQKCPRCDSLVFEAPELFLIEISPEGQVFLRSAGHEISRQQVSCKICGYLIDVRVLEKVYLEKKAQEKAKTECPPKGSGKSNGDSA